MCAHAYASSDVHAQTRSYTQVIPYSGRCAVRYRAHQHQRRRQRRRRRGDRELGKHRRRCVLASAIYHARVGSM